MHKDWPTNLDKSFLLIRIIRNMTSMDIPLSTWFVKCAPLRLLWDPITITISLTLAKDSQKIKIHSIIFVSCVPLSSAQSHIIHVLICERFSTCADLITLHWLSHFNKITLLWRRESLIYHCTSNVIQVAHSILNVQHQIH